MPGCSMNVSINPVATLNRADQINDGSHSAFNDDFYTPLDEKMVTKYLEIFRLIFQKSNQISHYNMMMGIIS